MVDNINLVLCTDRNNLWGLAVTVRSALEACSAPCNVYIIAVDLTYREQQLLRDSWQTDNTGVVEFFLLDKAVLAPFNSRNLPARAMYGRLFIAECFPKLPRCIYLDTDLIVNADVKILYETDLMDHVAGCVRDICVRDKKRMANSLERIRVKVGLNDPNMYFNSGIMLIDLEAWRQHQIGPKCVSVGIEMYDALDYHDQDILNVVLEGQWIEVDVKWNTPPNNTAVEVNDEILHLVGRVKPWHADSKSKFKDLFFEILDRTAFAGRRPHRAMGLEVFLKRISRRIHTVEMMIRDKVRRTMPGV